MFCLVTDLIDWEEYPGPGLAALYAWRWGTGPRPRCARRRRRCAAPGRSRADAAAPGPQDLVRQEMAAWAARSAITGGVILDAAVAAVPARKGRRAGLAVRPRDLLLRPRAPGGHVRHPRLGRNCYQAVTSEIAGYRNAVDRDRHRARESPLPRSRTRMQRTPATRNRPRLVVTMANTPA